MFLTQWLLELPAPLLTLELDEISPGFEPVMGPSRTRTMGWNNVPSCLALSSVQYILKPLALSISSHSSGDNTFDHIKRHLQQKSVHQP